MKIRIITKKFTLTDDVRDWIERKLKKFDKFFPEETEESAESEIPEGKPKFSGKTEKMKATVGNRSVSKEKTAKKSSKLFKFFNISVTKK